MERSSSPPPPSSPLLVVNSIRIPAGAEIVSDPDEEVFLLYSELQRTGSSSSYSSSATAFDRPHRGLGYVDSRKNVLSVVIELKGGVTVNGRPGSQPPQEEIGTYTEKGKPRRGVRNRGRKRNNKDGDQCIVVEDKTIEIDLVQDVTALRSRKGDTGSVLWHASVDFARFVLQQAHMRSRECIFDLEMLRCQHILELGAGTGVLSVLLSPLCRRYTVTDIEELLPLIQKNIDMNIPTTTTKGSNIRAVPLDWVVLKNTPPNRRHLLLPNLRLAREEEEEEEEEEGTMPIDILLIVDCIYHPSLLPPLIETINYLTRPNKKTIVVVVSELRSEQVVLDFLELWINSGGGGGGGSESLMRWRIYRCPFGMIMGPYVVWIGWKEAGDS